MIRTLLTAAALLAASATSAQTPFLVTDLVPGYSGGNSSDPAGYIELNGKILFQAKTAATGNELWQMSGDEVTLFKDFSPGASDGVASSIFPTTNGHVFVGYAPGVGQELLQTDGTVEGTALVKDIYTAAESGSGITFRGRVGTKILFTAYDGVHGAEPWVTDGTADGTKMLIDLDGTSAPTTIVAIASGETRSFIFARNTMWLTDGTPEGTTPTGLTIPNPRSPVVIGTTVYFLMATAQTGYELWKSDGTAAGTSMVKAIVPREHRRVQQQRDAASVQRKALLPRDLREQRGRGRSLDERRHGGRNDDGDAGDLRRERTACARERGRAALRAGRAHVAQRRHDGRHGPARHA